jgi:DNA repair photolyase
LANITHPDSWFGTKYNMNIYRGCEHQCIYCDSRSECYQIAEFSDVLVKVNALERLRDELPRKRVVGTIGTGAMSDPYTPAERHYNLTGQALEYIATQRFPVLIITKSDLILKDLAALRAISAVYAAVAFTITTADDDLAARLEPGAPAPSARLRAMATLAAAGVYVGVTMMPILPFLEDSEENVSAIMAGAKEAGAGFVLPGLAVTLRDRQRDYFYRALERLYPDQKLPERYARRYGESYGCPPPNAPRLEQVIGEQAQRLGLPLRMKHYQPHPVREQLSLFA